MSAWVQQQVFPSVLLSLAYKMWAKSIPGEVTGGYSGLLSSGQKLISPAVPPEGVSINACW